MFGAYRGDLERFLQSRLGSRVDWEDVAQEVYVRLAGYDRLETIDKPKAFIFRVAENIARDRARRASVRAADRHTSVDTLELADPGVSPEQSVGDRQQLARMVDAISSLEEPARTAFVLSRFENMTYAQIASHMGVSVKTVEKYISRSLTHLRALVG